MHDSEFIAPSPLSHGLSTCSRSRPVHLVSLTFDRWTLDFVLPSFLLVHLSFGIDVVDVLSEFLFIFLLLLLLMMMIFRVKTDMGLNSFTGISPAQSQALTEQAHIYLTQNGRISMAGLNSHNIRYFAESLDKVVRGRAA